MPYLIRAYAPFLVLLGVALAMGISFMYQYDWQCRPLQMLFGRSAAQIALDDREATKLLVSLRAKLRHRRMLAGVTVHYNEATIQLRSEDRVSISNFARDSEGLWEQIYSDENGIGNARRPCLSLLVVDSSGGEVAREQDEVYWNNI